jgi:hypothetical protein
MTTQAYPPTQAQLVAKYRVSLKRSLRAKSIAFNNCDSTEILEALTLENLSEGFVVYADNNGFELSGTTVKAKQVVTTYTEECLGRSGFYVRSWEDVSYITPDGIKCGHECFL